MDCALTRNPAAAAIQNSYTLYLRKILGMGWLMLNSDGNMRDEHLNDPQRSQFFPFTDFGSDLDEKVLIRSWKNSIETISQRLGLHRHDFYQIFWIASGTPEFTIDFDQFTVQSDSLVFVPPGSVHFWKIRDCHDGFSLSFQPDFLQVQGHVLDLYQECLPFDPVYYRPIVRLEEPPCDRVDAYFRQIMIEFAAKSEGYQTAIAALMRLIFIETKRSLGNQPTFLPNHRYSALTARFLRKLSRDPFKVTAASEVAQLLGVSRSWLNQLVRNETGKNITEHLKERLVLEAKRLLAHSEFNISEIAYQLGFGDASYFTRLFRQSEKCSPREFREIYR
jgi:AraC family transcriptional regulator, transcriptional activator of pobA